LSEIEHKQKIEIEFWRDSVNESPSSDSILNIINKASDATVFVDCLNRHQDQLVSDGRVLELGGGQGWASCIYKRLYPQVEITTTDISEHAVASLYKWQHLFNTKIDHSYACKSYEINEPDDSLDFIFCFASAHHFLAHKRTLNEISRVLKPGAKAIYFYEPATPKLFYKSVYKRVNKNRPSVPEDVLITKQIKQLAELAGLQFEVDYHPSLIKRAPVEMIYFYILSKITFIQKLLPCTANFIFTKEP
jgi:ubiquinone/menaquinone biosynthesis C-methylase UbiE